MSTNSPCNESNPKIIKIYFIFSADDPDLEQERNALLKEAFRALENEEGMEVKGKSQNACLSLVKPSKATVFVLANFEGEVFEHLRRLKCNILGPGLVLSCFRSEKEIKRSGYPVFSDCMEGIVACCTNLQISERAVIYDRVAMMQGQVHKDFTNEVNLIVTPEVGSRKYKTAVKLIRSGQLSLSIVTPAFVHEVWRRSQNEIFKVKDDKELLQKHRCPIFAGLTITPSNLGERKAEIKRLVEQHGGKFIVDMKSGQTTHLVTESTQGQKYESAKRWTDKNAWPIPAVGTAWIYKSVEAGYCLDEDEFLTEKLFPPNPRASDRNGRQKCSTPNHDASTSGAPFGANAQSITSIYPDIPNMTVASNASCSVVNSFGLDKTIEATKTICAPVFEILEAPPSPLKKRSRLMNSTASKTLVNDGAQTNRSQRASTAKGMQPNGLNDILSQYIDDDVEHIPEHGQGMDVTFRPNFDFGDALDKIAPVVTQPSVEESPTTRNLEQAAEATGVGAPVYGSPAVITAPTNEDVRLSFAKQLKTFLGRTTVKRHGSANTFTADTSSAAASPSAAERTITAMITRTTPQQSRTLSLTQDTQEQLVVDWEDPNQKHERQKVSGLLRKPHESTQNLLENKEEGRRETVAKQVEQRKQYFFQMTSVDMNRNRYVDIIKKLGGILNEGTNYDLNCTHLVIGRASRNEKLLSAIACGIWVLHVSYLDACDAAGRFVEETEYEFGTSGTARFTTGLREEVTKLTNACPKWRREIASGGSKPYNGWNVLLLTDKSKEDGFLRILTNGGAIATKNFQEAKEGVTTHVIVDGNHKMSQDLTKRIKTLEKAGAKWYRAEVIFGFLAGENPEKHLCKA